MQKEFNRFFKLAVESFIKENIENANDDLIKDIQEYSGVLIDDVMEFIDSEIFKILVNDYEIEI